MKLLRVLSLRGIGAQMAALVVVSIVALHLIITATFLIHRPDRPEPSDRWHTQLAAAAPTLEAITPWPAVGDTSWCRSRRPIVERRVRHGAGTKRARRGRVSSDAARTRLVTGSFVVRCPSLRPALSVTAPAHAGCFFAWM